MVEVGFQIVSAFDSGIHETRAVSAEGFEKGARIPAVLRAGSPVAGIESAKRAVGPEVRTFPEIHQAEDTGLDAPHPSCGISLEEMQFLEPFEYPEWEIDLDAMRIEDLAVEFVRQSFAYQQLVDFGAPARSRRGFEQGSRQHCAAGKAYLRFARTVKRIQQKNRALQIVTADFG